MKLRRPGLLIALLLSSLVLCFAVQAGSSEDIFAISVLAPTSPKDVQARYFLTDDAGGRWSSSTAQSDQNKIVIRTGSEAKPVRALKAILYAPGCEFVTITVDDLSASSRLGEFQCQKLRTTQFRGRTAISGFAQKDLQLEALYVCGWAQQFFGLRDGAISPFSLAKAFVEADGTFTFELPDFAADPLWASLSNDATLMFFLVDTRSGQRLASLSPPADLSSEGFLKVAHNYPPEVQFTVQSLDSGKAFKSSR
jgi:hypothetical protein